MSTMQSNILVFDTTTVACSVALGVDGKILSRHKESANIHSQALLQMIDELILEAGLNLSDINYLVVGVGPGSFTGLRIGIGVAQALAYTNDIEIIPISSVEMLAITALETNDLLANSGILAVAQDARMSEIYTATYSFNKNTKLEIFEDTLLVSPEKMLLPKILSEQESTAEQKSLYLCGSAWTVYAEKLTHIDRESSNTLIELNTVVPNTKYVAQYIGKYLLEYKAINWDKLSPAYVRNDVAKKTTKAKLINRSS